MDDEELYLREMIASLQRSYAEAIKPYVDRLVAIENMRLPAPIFISVEQARAIGLIKEGGSK